jgi:ubiquinone/menaquinone biosynthesis C-methylase UbiE
MVGQSLTSLRAIQLPPALVKATGGLTPVQRWLSAEELGRIYTSGYWNDVEAERHKEWWIEDGDYDRCRRYLQRSKLLSEYEQAEKFVRDLPGRDLQVADLAAGIGWTTALLSRIESVAEVHAVEISGHRLERLFPHCMSMFGGRCEKVRRYLGSFYDLKLPERSMDVVFLSQAFHHANRPLRLMAECDRVLKSAGRIVMVGEHVVGLAWLVRRCVKVLLTQGRATLSFRKLFPPDAVLGDHYYRLSDYEFLFDAIGYRLEHCVAATGQRIFVADKAAVAEKTD